MRFLEEAYESKGGSKYLYMLFDAMPDTRGVLMPIHELAGLPALRLETDGFRDGILNEDQPSHGG